MSHTTVTQSQPIPMPRHSGLLERKGRFYLNMRVPKELRSLYGKKEIIRKSLDTSDRSEAISRVRYEAFKLDAEFAERRRELKTAEAPTAIREISDRDAHNLVFNWFINLEKLSQEWCDKLDDDSVEDVLDNLRTDEVVFSGGSKDYRGEEADTDLDSFLKSAGIECPKGSPAYEKLLPLFTKARLENVRRTMARVTHQTVSPREPLFREVFAHTPPPSTQKPITIGNMVDGYHDYLTKANRSPKTHRTYDIPFRLLKEHLGEKTLVESITRDHIEQVCELLRKAPSNVTKRYRGLTLQQAIETADRKHDQKRLSGKSLENYFNNIVAIFNFAVEEGMLTKNPAKGRSLRVSFANEAAPKPKVLFAADELNQLFHSSLFTGDGSFSKEILHAGKAWVPLLSLFHGFRCNEVAQLYTEDVKTEDAIPYIDIREEREDGSKSDKRLKTKQSKRRVPIHPEILKMGFLTFVEQRRKDSANPRLFTDLTRGATEYYSDPFSKSFGRFVKRTLGSQCKATFHSFRHMFRDALSEAGVPIEDVERLGGWELMKHSAEREYGRGPSLKRLRLQIKKVKFPKLDLTHLHTD